MSFSLSGSLFILSQPKKRYQSDMVAVQLERIVDAAATDAVLAAWFVQKKAQWQWIVDFLWQERKQTVSDKFLGLLEGLVPVDPEANFAAAASQSELGNASFSLGFCSHDDQQRLRRTMTKA